MAKFSTLFTILIFTLQMKTESGRPSSFKVIRMAAELEFVGNQ